MYLDPLMQRRFAPAMQAYQPFDLGQSLGFPAAQPSLTSQYQAAAAPPPVADTGVADEAAAPAEEAPGVPKIGKKKEEDGQLGKKILGTAGAAAGSAIGGPIGGIIGGGLGSLLGGIF